MATRPEGCNGHVAVKSAHSQQWKQLLPPSPVYCSVVVYSIRLDCSSASTREQAGHSLRSTPSPLVDTPLPFEMSASLSAFIHQCLSEDKYGKQFVSEVADRIESLNYSQLEGMHKVLSASAKGARMRTWKNANNEILEHVEKWRKIRGDEYRRTKALEEELLRKIREKERNRLREINAKESVIRQLRQNARRDAEREIVEFEFKRKATYKMELYELVPKAEEKRYRYFKYAAGSFVIGCILCISVGVYMSQPFLIVIGIGVMVMVAVYLVLKGVKAGRVAPFEEDPEKIAHSVDVREEELFMKAMNQLKKVI